MPRFNYQPNPVPPVLNPDDIVFVKVFGDFPTPVATVITLDATKKYWVEGSIPMAGNSIVGNNSTIFGLNPDVDKLTSNSGTMFTGSEGIRIVGMGLDPGFLATIFGMTNVGAGTESVILNDCMFGPGGTFGTITDYLNVRISDSIFEGVGAVALNGNTIVSITGAYLKDVAGPFTFTNGADAVFIEGVFNTTGGGSNVLFSTGTFKTIRVEGDMNLDAGRTGIIDSGVTITGEAWYDVSFNTNGGTNTTGLAGWLVASTVDVQSIDDTDSPFVPTAANNKINCDCTAGNIIINLPASSTLRDGQEYWIKKTDVSANTVTINRNGAETIDGAVSKLLDTQYESLTIYTDGSNFFVGDPAQASIVPANIGASTIYTVNASDFTAAANTQAITLFSLLAGYKIYDVSIKSSVAFSRGTSTAFTLSVGITGVLDKYATAFDVFQAVGDTVFQTSEANAIEDYGSATTVRVTAISTNDTLDNIGTGTVAIEVFTRKIIA